MIVIVGMMQIQHDVTDRRPGLPFPGLNTTNQYATVNGTRYCVALPIFNPVAICYHKGACVPSSLCPCRGYQHTVSPVNRPTD